MRNIRFLLVIVLAGSEYEFVVKKIYYLCESF
jgi:hypothetical protein